MFDAGVATRFDELFERRYPSTTPQSAALVDRICSSSRAENRAAAAQLEAISELFAHRLSRCSDTESWAVDTMEAVTAELAAALRIGQGLAGSRLRYARAMRERLPKVAELFKAGDIDYRTFQTIVYRTDLITDPGVLGAVDVELVVKIPRWPSMTRGQLAGQVDKIVVKADSDAVRRCKERQADRQIWIGDLEGGVSEIHGSMFTPDAHALEKRLNALSATVCEHDPRTRDQRRADALGALAAAADRLGCRCGRPDCAAGKRPAATPVVIHVIAEQSTIDGCGSAPASEVGADALIAPELVAELAKSAKLVSLVHPGDAPPEPGYVPSKALADFVRCRDLTCRWPGCDRPAQECDLDHTIPHTDGGPTHASNLKCYCRTHHRMRALVPNGVGGELWRWQSRYRRGGRGGYSRVMTDHGDGALSDASIAAMSPDERRDLIHRLQRPLDEVIPPQLARRMRRTRLTLMVGGSIALIPWIVYLGFSLPPNYVAQNWPATWMGFDCLLVAFMAATAVLGWLRRQLVLLTAFTTGVLLICDAWFDILTAGVGRNLAVPMLTAALGNLPLAAIMMTGAVRIVRLTAVRLFFLDPETPLWRLPLLP